jgi:hypothetical protein
MATAHTAPNRIRQPSSSAVAPRRHLVAAELMAGAALMFSTVVAVTAVTIGIARAAPLGDWRADAGSLDVAVWTVTVLVGLSILSGVITWLVPNARRMLRPR